MEANKLPHTAGMFTRHIFTITLTAVAMLIFVQGYQWHYSNKALSQFKAEMTESYANLVKDGYHRPIKLETTTTKDGTITLDEKEFKKLNAYLDYLSSEIKRESNRAESIIDKDLDRLNFNMAVGIGFMTLLGVFVPILVNITTSQELKSRQDILEKGQDKLDKEIKKTQSIADKLPELQAKLKMSAIDIANQDMQNVVGKFHYIGPTLLSSSTNKSLIRFVNLIKTLKTAITKCKELEIHSTQKNKVLKSIFEDLYEFLDSVRFKFHIILHERKDVDEIDVLITALKELTNPTENNEGGAYEKVFIALDKIIDTVQNKIRGNEDKS